MPAQSSGFDEIYAIGDSLSDSGGIDGGIYTLSSLLITAATHAGISTQGLQPLPSAPYAGVFSNGPVLPEYLAELLGAKLFNFSFGGAEALGTLTFGAVAAPAIPPADAAAIAALPPTAPINVILNQNINMSGQLANFVNVTSANPPSAHSALTVMMGLNDLQALIGNFDPNNPQAVIAAVTQAVTGIVQADLGVANTAFNQGIGTVIFETLPATSFFPLGHSLPPAAQTIGDAAVVAINQGIAADAALLQSQGHDVRVVDLAAFTAQISADPAAFGFENLAQPTLNGVTFNVSPNPLAPPLDQTAFFDAIHATTKLHDLMAQFVAQSLGVTNSANGDAYVANQGQAIVATTSNTVLLNDTGTSLAASLVTGPAHGAFQLHTDGSFNYTPSAGFTGIDSFTYAATNGTGTSDAQALLYVVPVNSAGGTTTLNLFGLNAEEQIQATYVAFFSRGADKAGFEFWVNLFNQYKPSLGNLALFQNIASSFGVSDEAKALYPFLANPAGASDAQIGSFLNSVYENMFNRDGDAPGLAYWTGQIKLAIAAGRFVGDVLVSIIGGAQNNAGGQDITTLTGKVAVGLEYVHQQEQLGTGWSFATDGASATALLHAVTADATTVLTGIKQADVLVHADVH